jgi:transposase
MMLIPPGLNVHLAPGFTDLRRGIDGLAVLVEQVLERDPFSGHMFAFRGRRADMIKILYWDGTGLCLFVKRLEDGYFPWPYNAPGHKETYKTFMKTRRPNSLDLVV